MSIEYEDILATLAEGGLQVISEVRRPETQIPFNTPTRSPVKSRGYLTHGVPPGQITVVGVSKGGGIAILAASLPPERPSAIRVSCRLQEKKVLDDQNLTIAGRALSIYEASDEMGISCQPLFSRSSRGSVFKEIRLETGLAHGEFYTPRPEWVDPTVKWAWGEG